MAKGDGSKRSFPKGQTQSAGKRDEVTANNRQQRRQEEHAREAARADGSGATTFGMENSSRRDNIDELIAGIDGIYAFPGGEEASIHLDARLTYNNFGKRIMRITFERLQAGHKLAKEGLRTGVYFNAAWIANEEFKSTAVSEETARTQNLLIAYLRELADGPFEVRVKQDQPVVASTQAQARVPNDYETSFELSSQEEDKHVIRGYINTEVGGKQVMIHLVKSKNFADIHQWGFIPKKLVRDQSVIWEASRDSHASWNLYRTEADGFVLCFQTKKELLEIVSVTSECSKTPVIYNGVAKYVGGLSVVTLANLKKKFARALGRTPVYSTSEKSALTSLQEYEEKQKKQAKTAEAEKRKQAALAADAAIRTRAKVTVFREDGSTFTGYPVVGDEWRNLITEDRSPVIVMEDKKPRVAFTVFADDGNFKNSSKELPVFAENPLLADAPKVVGEQDVMMPEKDVMGKVPIAESMDDVRKMRERGMNSGSPVLCPVVGKEGRLTLLKVHHDSIETVCELTATTV